MKSRPDRTQVLKQAPFPIQIIAGAEDTLLEPAEQAKMAEMPGMGSFSVLQHAGHMGMLEFPEKLVSLLSSFFKETALF
jgi:pimeloyl-ACP methyl ester carboxylesterase